MKKITSLMLLALSVGNVYAQEFKKVDHINGVSNATGIEVTVSSYGTNAALLSFDGLSPYHIGNKKQPNGYDFSFSEPVSKLNIHMTAINAGEVIEVGINGMRYNLTKDLFSKYEHGERQAILPTVQDGVIIYNDEKSMASATITIAPGYDINSVYVHHLNGKAAGSVFELWYEGSAPTTTTTDQVVTSTGSVSTTGKKLNLYPNPSDGSFTISGNGFNGDAVMLQIVNVAGQELVRKTVTPLNGVIKEQVNMSQDIPNGVYTVLLTADDQQQALRFTLNR